MEKRPEVAGFSGPSRLHVPSFPSYVMKVLRAIEHLGELYAAAQIFSEVSAYSLHGKTDPDTGEKVLKIRLASQPPITFGTLAADCVHSLRQSLDHLAYKLAVSISGSDPPPNEATAGFPIHNSSAGFKGNLAAKIGDPDKIPRPILKTLNELQPYNSWEGKQLAILRDLDNRAKHRELPICVGVVRPTETAVEGDSVVLKSLRTGPVEEGETEIARFEVSKPNVQVEVRGWLSIEIVFGSDSPAEGQSVVKYLQTVRAMLLRKVMPSLMPEDFRVNDPIPGG